MLSSFPSRIDKSNDYRFLKKHQMDTQVKNCLQCSRKPCKDGCPCQCCPSDFIHALDASDESAVDYSALLIYSMSPCGASCGSICPTSFCMKNCTRGKLDSPINIPGVQAEITRRAHARGNFLKLIPKPVPNHKKVAIVGAGPAGLACAGCLASRGYAITIFEKTSRPGGDTVFIPPFRFPKTQAELDFKTILATGDIKVQFNTEFNEGMTKDFDAVCLAIGMQIDQKLGCRGDDYATPARAFLSLDKDLMKGKSVIVVGCGAVALDCASFALRNGAENARIVYRRKYSEARLHPIDRGTMEAMGIGVTERMIIEYVTKEENGKLNVFTSIADEEMKPVPNTQRSLGPVDFVVAAAGQKSTISDKMEKPPLFVAGQARGRATAAIQASASGKNAARRIHCFLSGQDIPTVEDDLVSDFQVFKPTIRPVSIETTFNNKKVVSPYIAASSPFTESLANCRKLLSSNWGGVVIGIGQKRRQSISRPVYLGHTMVYEPNKTIKEAQDDLHALRIEFPNAVLGASISSHSVAFMKTMQALAHNLDLDFIQVNVDNEEDRIKAQVSLDIMNRSIPVFVHCLHSPTVDSNSIAIQNITSANEALDLFARGAKIIQVEPGSYKRGSGEIHWMNAALSISLFSQGFQSLESYHPPHKQVEIEDIDCTMLINHLSIPTSCIACGRCEVCPNDAITLIPSRWIYDVDPVKCVGCGLCVSKCPTGAISLIPRSTLVKSDKEH